MLDRCPGCSKEVSDTADECPGCGFKFVEDAPPPQTHADVDNDPVLDGPASLESTEQTLDGPASQELNEDDLLAIQTGSVLPKSMEDDSFETPQRVGPPPKSQSTGFVVAGLCIAAMAISSYYFKHQKQVEAERVAAVEAETIAEKAKARIAVERLAAEKAAALAKAVDEERLATAASEAEEKTKKKKKRRRRKGRRSNELEAPSRKTGLPDEPAVVTTAQPVSANYGTLDIPSTDSGTPDFGSDFRVKGAVYDLYTMEPIGEADVVFSDLKSGKQLSTVTDDSGVYRAHLPINGKGYTLKIRHSQYEPKYISDDGNIKGMTADQRRAEGTEMLRTMGRAHSFNAIRKKVIKQDFMLVPR